MAGRGPESPATCRDHGGIVGGSLLCMIWAHLGKGQWPKLTHCAHGPRPVSPVVLHIDNEKW